MCVCRSQQQLSDKVFLHIGVKRDLQTLFLLVHLKSYKQSNKTANSYFIFSQPLPPLEEAADQQDNWHTPHREADADILYDVNRCVHFCRCTVV